MDAPDPNRFDLGDSQFAGEHADTIGDLPSQGPGGSPASSPDDHPLIAGADRIGHYEIVGKLGAGGMGVVLRAHDPILKRPVAIKVLRSAQYASKEQMARFQIEAKTTARLQHPAIVGIHEVGIHQGMPYLVMDLIEGQSLQALLDSGPLSPRRSAEIVLSIAEALDHAHENDVIHRDVKPHNIIINEQGRPFLTDFGLALDTTLQEQLTLSGELVGTPAFMAPEQVDSECGPITGGTDVYALGTLLYVCITGHLPFVAKTPVILLRKILLEEPTPPRQLDQSIHLDLETITMRCMDKTTLGRYATASDLAAELRRFLQGEAILARPLGRAQRLGRWTRRHKAISAMLSLLLLAAVALGVSLLALLQSKRQQDANLAAQAETLHRQERERLLQAAAADAAQSQQNFIESLAKASSNEPRQQELAIGHGLRALEAQLRLVQRQPANETQGRLAAVETALTLANLAIEARQWAVAQDALNRVAPFELNTPRLRSAQEQLGTARNHLADTRRKAVLAVLDAARSGYLLRPRGIGSQGDEGAFRGTYDDALFALVGYRDSQTVELVAQALADVTHELRVETRSFWLEANHLDASGRPADDNRIPGLVAAITDWLRGDSQQTAPTGALASAQRRLLARERQLFEMDFVSAEGRRITNHPILSTDDRGRVLYTNRPIGLIVASRQTSAVGINHLNLAKLCCQTLGRLGLQRDLAAKALTDHLRVERDEHRASHAGQALAQLGGTRAIQTIHLAITRFGHDSHFARLVGRQVAASLHHDLLQESGSGQPMTTATLLLHATRYQEAEQTLNHILESEPAAAEALILRSRARFAMKLFPAALADAEAAREIEPESAAAWVARARAKLMLGALAGSQQDILEATRLDPERAATRAAHAWIVKSIGDYLVSQGNADRAQKAWAQAIQLANQALTLAPHHIDALSTRADALLGIGSLDQAIDGFSKVLALDPARAEAWGKRGRANRLANNLAAAVHDHSRALELDPDHFEGWLRRATARFQLGDFDGSIADFARSLELEPDNPDTLVGLAQAQWQSGDLTLAIETASHAIRVAPSHPTA